MPFYEYVCEACGPYTRKKKISERAHDVCDCGSEAAKAVTAPAGAYVRGGGAAAHAGSSSSTQRNTHGVSLTKQQSDSLPVVGRDGKLYSSDGSRVLRG